MKTYSINLRNINDFRSYVCLFDICDISAEVSEGDRFRIDAHDIVALFCHWPYKHLLLTIKNIHHGNINEIESFLSQSHLLTEEIIQHESSIVRQLSA